MGTLPRNFKIAIDHIWLSPFFFSFLFIFFFNHIFFPSMTKNEMRGILFLVILCLFSGISMGLDEVEGRPSDAVDDKEWSDNEDGISSDEANEEVVKRNMAETSIGEVVKANRAAANGTKIAATTNKASSDGATANHISQGTISEKTPLSLSSSENPVDVMQPTTRKPTTTKKKKTKPKTNIFVINKTKPEPEENLILGLKWWQFLCIVFGSVLALMFVCLCCCAIMDSAQRHEVRGNNGQRLGFFQAPGRHIILVMDNQLGRFRGNHGGASTATPPAQTMQPTAATADGNPPHAPTVQPAVYPKLKATDSLVKSHSSQTQECQKQFISRQGELGKTIENFEIEFEGLNRSGTGVRQ